MNQPHRRAQRRKFAEELMDKRNALTDQEQLEKLDRLLGKGVGATKERNRLLKRIEASKPVKAPKKDENASEATPGPKKKAKAKMVMPTTKSKSKAEAKK